MDYGDLVTFSYTSESKAKGAPHDPYPVVLVLHPNYEGKLHGIRWKMLSMPDQEIIKMILSEAYEAQNKNHLARRDPESAKRFDSVSKSSTSRDIRTASQFYSSVIKPLLSQRASAYRLYRLDKIKGASTVTPAALMTAKLGTQSPPPQAPPGATPGPAPAGQQSMMQNLKSKGQQMMHKAKKGVWESYVGKSRGTRGPLLPNRAPNFKKK